MIVRSYRVETEDETGKILSYSHYPTLEIAEQQLQRHKICLEYLHNLIPSNKRYGTIWESDLDCGGAKVPKKK